MFNFKSKLSAKKRFNKIKITEQAINKVPYIEYKGIDKKTCEIIQDLAKIVLRISKEQNDNNEVAITFKVPIEVITEGKSNTEIINQLTYGVAYGDENSVVLESDTLTNHILTSTNDVAVIVLHNHPTPQTLSYDDLIVFFLYASIKMMLVVTNQGKIHYIIKKSNYEYSKASALMAKYSKLLDKTKELDETYLITKKLLKECNQIGLFYQ